MDRDEYVAKLDHLVKEYETAKGRIDSWWRRGKSESRTRLAAAVNAEMDQVLSMSVKKLNALQNELDRKYLPARAAETRALETVQRASEIAWLKERTVNMIETLRLDTENKKAVYRAASREGLTPETHMEIRKMQVQAAIDLQAQLDRMNLEVQRELHMMRIRLEEAREMALVQLEAQLRLKLIENQGAIQLQEGDYSGRIRLHETETKGRIDTITADATSKSEVEVAAARLAAELIHQKNMSPFRELDELNERLAELQRQAQQATTQDDIDRLHKQINTFKRTINERSKQL